MSFNKSSSRLSKALGLGALFAALSSAAFAQEAILSADFLKVLGTSENVTNFAPGSNLLFQGYTNVVTGVTTGTTTYTFAPSSGNSVFFRANGLFQPDVLLQSAGAGKTSGEHYTDLGSLLGSGSSYSGVKAIFDNTSGGLERIDVRFASNYTVQAGDALVFFGLNVTSLQSFRVAATTAWTGGFDTAPSAYASTGALISGTDFGVGLKQPDGLPLSKNFYTAEYSNGEDLIGQADSLSAASAYNLYGVVIRLTDLNIAVGTVINGFSIMAGDVSPATAADLVDYTTYSTTTNSTLGGFNFTSFSSAIASPVPEPSTYGMLLTAGSLGFFAWRRRRQARASAQS